MFMGDIMTLCTKSFSKLFSELEDCNEDEQKVKIEEMNGLMNEMEEDEFFSVFNKQLFDRMNILIDKKKIATKDSVLMLKHIGYRKELKSIWMCNFENSLLCERIEKMIVDEDMKKEENDEKLHIDACECYLFLNNTFSNEHLSICIPCLLKVASDKEKNKEALKEVEMALLALSGISDNHIICHELYLNEIAEILIYHQHHSNLTRLAYQSAWRFLLNRLVDDESSEEIIVSKLHFIDEATKELEELAKNVSGKRNEEERRRQEMIEYDIIKRWIIVFDHLFMNFKSWNVEYAGLVRCLAGLIKPLRDNKQETSNLLIYLFYVIAQDQIVSVDELQKEGVIDQILEEINQKTINKTAVRNCLKIFSEISRGLKGELDNETKKAERNFIKMKIIEKMEEKGFEDIIMSLNDITQNTDGRNFELPFNYIDYFVFV
ncbi:uncharacterized protein MONOS_17423 [Monocercomonoides exilis]|uniref:uncharacterized protein n=1 Tax=Monocercomonoides exilis TaxID=2049356 RepID=UPI0035596CC4|nr:hypothetical protein MONOS_17423 [Monocercomonoides exilis]